MVEIHVATRKNKVFDALMGAAFTVQVEFCGMEEERGTEFLAYAAL